MVKLVEHPLASHVLACLRDAETQPEQFRALSKVLTTILLLEATRDVPTLPTVVQTPLAPAQGQKLGKTLAVVPILRAGLAMLEPALSLFPDVSVGYIGLERHHDTAVAHSYYLKLPPLAGKHTLCFDPMLATGGSACQAVSLLKASGAERIAMVCVVAAPEGAQKFQSEHPDVDVYVAAVDERLDERSYIVPGLGDFGDRLFGTL